MAKGLRSKVKKRWRSLKRAHVEEVKLKSDLQEISSKLHATIHNKAYRVPEAKNAFLFPNDPSAAIPKYVQPQLIDFRSQAIPMAGTQYVGARREKKAKKVTETKTIIVNDFEEEPQEQQAPLVDEADDLAAALDTLGVKSKKEKQKLNRQSGMEVQKKIEKKSNKVNKRKRTESRRNRFKQ